MNEAQNYEAAIDHATDIKLFIKTLKLHLTKAANASRKYKETADKLAGLMVPPLDASFTGITTSVKRTLVELAKVQTRFAELCLATCDRLTHQHDQLKDSKAKLRVDLGRRKGVLAEAQRSYKDIKGVKKAGNPNSELSEDVWKSAACAYEQCIGKIAKDERRIVGKYRVKVLEITNELEEISRHFEAFAQPPSALNSNCAPSPQSSLKPSERTRERRSERLSERRSEGHSEQPLDQFTERHSKQISHKISRCMESLSKSHSRSRSSRTLQDVPIQAVKCGTDEAES
jgi:hypothetical protein